MDQGMTNIILMIASLLMLVPIFLFVLNRKYYYLSLVLLYPFLGQLIGTEINLFNFSLNPSMVFGFLILFLTALDAFLHPVKHPALELSVLIFIVYALMTCFFSPVRFRSITWVMKIVTWLLILTAAIKVFTDEKDTQRIHLTVSFATVAVIISFFLSYLGFYGDTFTYETGVESHGAGFSSGKTLAYYLAFAIPVLAWNTDRKNSISALLSYLLIAIALVVIVLTFVRAPVVALLVGFAAFQYFLFKYGGKSFSKIFLVLCVLIAVLSSVYFVLGHSRIMSRWVEIGEKYEEGKIDKLGSGRVGGLMGFYEYYVQRASLLKKIFGSGIGSSYVYLGNKKYIHNDFAEILMGCGVIGFSLYLFILAKIFLLLKRTQKKTQSPQTKRLGALGLSHFFVLLAFHMTNVTSGVIYLSMWAIATGAIIGIEQAETHRQWLKLQQAKLTSNRQAN